MVIRPDAWPASEEIGPVERPSHDRPAEAEVIELLRRHHGADPADLEVLDGGFWSAAYGYRIGEEELVLRLNDGPDGFRADKLAMSYRSPGLPVPEVLAVGQALGRWYAISRRHHGRFLEQVGPAESGMLGPTVVDLLAALRSVPDTGVGAPPWDEWLLEGLADVPGRHTSGWRARVAAVAAVDDTLRRADARIRTLLGSCPDRRQLVHGDLLHFNVLVSPAADAVTAVFSWKCSTWGDALYDLAWLTFWGRWHEGIGALDLWDLVVPALPAAEAIHASVRHHAYELQIGASHLGWYATLDDQDLLAWTARQLDEILDTGPRT